LAWLFLDGEEPLAAKILLVSKDVPSYQLCTGDHVELGIFFRPKLAPAFLKGFFSPPTRIRCPVLCVEGGDTSSRRAGRCCLPLAPSPNSAHAANEDGDLLSNRSSSRRSAGKATGRHVHVLEGPISGAGPSGKLWWSEWFVLLVLLGQCADEEEEGG
jgi:hypothetical protein